MRDFKNLQIAVAGTGYVGLSMATLLAQHHKVTAVDVIPEKVEKINNRISPIQDEYIEKFFGEKELNYPRWSICLQGCRLCSHRSSYQLRSCQELLRHSSH